MKYLGWDELVPGAILFSFDKELEKDASEILPEDRPYAETNSYTAYVGDWRVLKPVYNRDLCIDCQFCWIYCPDISIISRDKKMIGVDYDHCKGCGICVEVCPTNPKSLLMFEERIDNDEALAQWPEKE
ncbi:4Fe-4S dicluster-binding protein [Hydrogenimonas thermophila]|uniref:Pyruvate ferredoxin oxidoreductase delta subunit n=1 Tax=Hydrogenimonas thermophila TaxID=223786 RepID=A0A1I5L7W5_9BACT|nr:4Fe-4S dicluster-binding protein [Hydrogenimonas thermophila]WOE70095.1 4Fe-4S binding protein [Hydrogenimonas thermophila]WOE72612.1 4Fe-4S binding protein [Hydrogenimonas thermophila]SFO93429.1 pyruvate ferredoxin oxidoreductase delta subunit [Hydrogenimonas thermophila]